MSAILLPSMYSRIDYSLHHHGIEPYKEWYVTGLQHFLIFLSGVFVGIVLGDLLKSLIVYFLGIAFNVSIMYICIVLPSLVGASPEGTYQMFSFTAAYLISRSLMILPLFESLVGVIFGFFLSELRIFQDYVKK